MAFYENTILIKQDLPINEVNIIKKKYDELIRDSSGKVIKIEEWGLLKLATNIKNYNKAFFIHFKFEGNNKTLIEMKKKIRLDTAIIRHLTVKYKNLDTEKEYFKKEAK